MTSPAAVAYMTSTSRRFLSSAYHHRAAPVPVDTLVESLQRVFSITLLQDKIFLPRGTSFLQFALFDLAHKEPLGLPLRFRVNEVGEISPDAFGEHFVRGSHQDRLYLVLEAISLVDEPQGSVHPFREECLAFGWFPLGMRSEERNKAVAEITLHQGSALGFFSSPEFRPTLDSNTRSLGGVSIGYWIAGKAAPSKLIFPSHRFIPSRIVSLDTVTGGSPLNTMTVTLESCILRYGGSSDSTGSAQTTHASITHTQWNLGAMTHSGYKGLSQMASTNLSQYETLPNVFKTTQSVGISTDTPIHPTSHLVLVLRRQGQYGQEGVALGILQLCPKVSAVRDAILRVELLPLLNGPFIPSPDATPAQCVPIPFNPSLGTASTATMFTRSEWACSLILKISNTPVPATAANNRITSSVKIQQQGGKKLVPPLSLADIEARAAAANANSAATAAAGGGGGGGSGRNRQIEAPPPSAEEQLQQLQQQGESGDVSQPKPPQQQKGGKKKKHPTHQLDMPQVADYSEDPSQLKMTNAQIQELLQKQQQQDQLLQQQHGESGSSSNINVRKVQDQIQLLRSEMFNMLKEISSEVNNVRGEIDHLSKQQKSQNKLNKLAANQNVDSISVLNDLNDQQQQNQHHHQYAASASAAAAGGGSFAAPFVGPGGTGARRPFDGKAAGYRVADAPIARAQTALSSKLRQILLSQQKPIRHPVTQEPLAPESILCSVPLPDTRFCIRVNGLTLKGPLALPSFATSEGSNDSRTIPRKFAFRIHCGLAVQRLEQAGTLASQAPLPSLTAGVVATAASGEVLYSLKIDQEDSQSFTQFHAASFQQSSLNQQQRMNSNSMSSSGGATSAAGGGGGGVSGEENVTTTSIITPAELLAAQCGHWLEPEAPSDVHLASTIPAYVRRLRKERNSLLFSTVPASITIEILDGVSRFPLGFASVPLDAFNRPATTTHTVKEEDLVIRAENSFWRDAPADAVAAQQGGIGEIHSNTGGGGNALKSNVASGNEGSNELGSICPAHRPFLGTLHVSCVSIGYKALDVPSSSNNNNNNINQLQGSSGSARGTTIPTLSSTAGENVPNSPIGNLSPRIPLVEVPKLGGSQQLLYPGRSQTPNANLAASAAAGGGNNNNNNRRNPIPPHLRDKFGNENNNNSSLINQSGASVDGSGFLTSPRLTHLHAKRIECLKMTVLSARGGGDDSLSARGGGGGDQLQLDYQTRILDKKREEQKQDRIAEALSRRMQLDTHVVVPSGRPTQCDFIFKNPYPATMAFSIEFLPQPSDNLIKLEASAGFGPSFQSAPLEGKTITICCRAFHTNVARSGIPQCVAKARVLDDKGEVVKVLCVAATVLPPQVDRVLHIYGGEGKEVSKDIFVRCFDSALIVSGTTAKKGQDSGFGLSRLNQLIQRLTCQVLLAGDEVQVVKDASTGAKIQYLYDGAVATWEELFLTVAIPKRPTTCYLHIYGDQRRQNCLMSWALQINPVVVFDSQPVYCGQTNLITLPMTNMKHVFTSAGTNTDLAVSATIVPASATAMGQRSGASGTETRVQLRAKPRQPREYSVLIHAAESEAAAQAGRIHVTECRIPARLCSPNFERTLHFAPSTVPLFLRVVVRNEDPHRQRAFNVANNLEGFVTLKPQQFALGPGDQQAVSVGIAAAALASGHGPNVSEYTVRLTVTDDDDRISDVFAIKLIIDPAAKPIISERM